MGWVQWVDVRDVIRKCAAKGAGQPLPAGEPGSNSVPQQLELYCCSTHLVSGHAALQPADPCWHPRKTSVPAATRRFCAQPLNYAFVLCVYLLRLLCDVFTDAEGLHCFEVKGTYNPTTKKVTDAPQDFKAADAMEVDREAGSSAAGQQQPLDPTLAMASMDIFAGCGGLSEGMHQVRLLARGSAASPQLGTSQLWAAACMGLQAQARRC